MQKATVHRITVHPDWMRTGVAGRLFDFAEEFAKERGYTSLRFDTYSENPRSLALYAKRGYDRLPGEIFFPDENDKPYFIFEKLL